MKGFWMALVLLVLVTVLVITNAQFVINTQTDLAQTVETFPALPSKNTTDAISELRERFTKVQKTLSLSVNFYELDRINELLLSLEIYASAGDTTAYASTRALLLDALQHLSRLEQISWERIF